jgi:hypothetical protein
MQSRVRERASERKLSLSVSRLAKALARNVDLYVGVRDRLAADVDDMSKDSYHARSLRGYLRGLRAGEGHSDGKYRNGKKWSHKYWQGFPSSLSG